jgi:hypothetical protein
MALLSELRLDNGALAGRCHEVNYATFLYWKRNRAETAEHALCAPGAGQSRQCADRDPDGTAHG